MALELGPQTLGPNLARVAQVPIHITDGFRGAADVESEPGWEALLQG